MLNVNANNVCRVGMIGFAAYLLAGCSKEPEQASAPPAPAEPAQTSAAAPECAPQGPLNYVCGPKNAEDIVQLGSSDWLVTSGLTPLGQPPASAPGRIYLVNHKTKAHEEWFPGTTPAIKHDAKTFGECSGPINTANFSSHGLALREQGANSYRMYMTSHGEREAIEVFDIDASGEKPAISWIGCVVLPDKTFSNSVAILSDGGFVTTKMMDPTAPDGFEAVTKGEITGLVYEWHPGGKVTEIAGSQLSGANGIEVSPDQRWMFVAAFGGREIVRFDRNAKPMAKQTVQLDITPDNLRWTADGKLYTAGGNYVPAAQAAECQNPPCSTGWSVYEIDPQSLKATRIAGADQMAALQSASTALLVGNDIWIGTYSGDRVAYLPKP
jgi:hypothetical protein